jgi:hypothetical protein
MMVVFAVAVFFLMSGASFAQAPQTGPRDGDGWHFQGHSDPAYDRGLRDGRSDREHGRGWHPHNNGQAYLNGYRAGFGRDGGGWQGRRDNDRDVYRGGNGGYRNPGAYGNNAQTIAYNNGYREGVGYGQSDRNNGHSYRPTYSATYRNGHNGYNSSYGSEMAYKRAFQDGFRAGYDRGYNGGGYRRR